MMQITLRLAISARTKYELWNHVYDGRKAEACFESCFCGPRRSGFWLPLKLNVDTAFDQAWVLADLRSGRPERLVQKVPGIENRLNFTGEHPPGRQILSD